MSNKSKDILLEHNISITNPRIIVLDTVLNFKNPISIEESFKSKLDRSSC